MGPKRLAMANHGELWPVMAWHVQPWPAMKCAEHGWPWPSMASYGQLWPVIINKKALLDSSVSQKTTQNPQQKLSKTDQKSIKKPSRIEPKSIQTPQEEPIPPWEPLGVRFCHKLGSFLACFWRYKWDLVWLGESQKSIFGSPKRRGKQS